MTIRLTSRDLDPAGVTPLYHQLAERLRVAMEAGELVPGDAVPSEAMIMRAAGVSRTVIRGALRELEASGLIARHPGAQARVVARPVPRVVEAARYRAVLHQLVDEGAVRPIVDDRVVEAAYTRGRARVDDAALLRVAVGTPVLRRRLVTYLDGEPAQLRRGVVPLSVARATALEDPTAQPYPGGTVAELYAAGYRVTRVTEDLGVTTPSAEERRLLRPHPNYVLHVDRVFFAAGRVVEASRITRPIAATVLRHDTPLTSV